MNSDIDGDEICDNDDSCPDVAGLAKFAPAASNATEKGCQQNRRVDVKAFRQ